MLSCVKGSIKQGACMLAFGKSKHIIRNIPNINHFLIIAMWIEMHLLNCQHKMLGRRN